MSNTKATPHNLYQWFKLFSAAQGNFDAPARVRRVTPEHLKTIDELLDKYDHRWGWLKDWKVSALLGLVATYAFYTAWFDYFMGSPTGGTAIAVTSPMVLIAAWALFAGTLGVVRGLTGSHSAYWARHYMQPLAQLDEDCERALKLVNKYSVCRAYRDDVVATGRALIRADLNMLELLAMQAAKAEKTAMQQARCRELHGLPT